MNGFAYRLKPILYIFFTLLTPAAWGQVSNVTLFNQGARNLAAGSINNPILGLSVTLTGTDSFNSLAISNLGSAVTNTDITNVQVWWQTANGQFSPAKASVIGVLQPTSSNTWKNLTPFSY